MSYRQTTEEKSYDHIIDAKKKASGKSQHTFLTKSANRPALGRSPAYRARLPAPISGTGPARFFSAHLLTILLGVPGNSVRQNLEVKEIKILVLFSTILVLPL